MQSVLSHPQHWFLSSRVKDIVVVLAHHTQIGGRGKGSEGGWWGEGGGKGAVDALVESMVFFVGISSRTCL